ncbi:MAG: NAD-dependent epimerase, partial [Rhizobiales bacterium]|nr:NAD-dependent epimerase [Hyphomicrobiales bacterium]
MHILITGAAGMIGRKLTERLARDGALHGKPIERLTLTDVVAAEKPVGFTGRVETRAEDLPASGIAGQLVAAR